MFCEICLENYVHQQKELKIPTCFGNHLWGAKKVDVSTPQTSILGGFIHPGWPRFPTAKKLSYGGWVSRLARAPHSVASWIHKSLGAGWTNKPIWKICASQMGSIISPTNRGKKKNILWNQHLGISFDVLNPLCFFGGDPQNAPAPVWDWNAHSVAWWSPQTW